MKYLNFSKVFSVPDKDEVRQTPDGRLEVPNVNLKGLIAGLDWRVDKTHGVDAIWKRCTAEDATNRKVEKVDSKVADSRETVKSLLLARGWIRDCEVIQRNIQ